MDNNELGTNLAEVGTNCSEFPNNSDAISRQAAIDALVAETIYTEEELREYYEANSHRNEWVNGIYDAVEAIKQLPPIQPEITHEQAVAYLQSTGWMQEHDRQMMLDGVHRLTAQPEIIRCRECKFASGDSRICMKFDHSPIGELDFCSFAERREVTT